MFKTIHHTIPFLCVTVDLAHVSPFHMGAAPPPVRVGEFSKKTSLICEGIYAIRCYGYIK